MANSDNIQAHFLIPAGFSFTITTISVFLRFVGRRLNRQRPFPDDWLILAALMSDWALTIAGLLLVQNGLGRHINDVDPASFANYLKILYTGAPLYALTIVLIKISLISLYHRIFPNTFITYCCLVVGTVVISWGLTTAFMGLFICNPVHKAWQPETPGKCLNLVQFYYGLQIPNIATDLVILALPLQPIYRLLCSTRKKVMLGALFGVGFLVVVLDIIRLIAMLELEGKGSDITWNQVPTSIWTCVEPAVAISAACMPHIKPVVKLAEHYFWPQLKSQSEVTASDDNNRSRDAIRTLIPPSISDTSDASAVEGGHSSPERIDFMAHITRNVADPEAGSIECDIALSSQLLDPCSPSYHSLHHNAVMCLDAPPFPEVIDLFSVPHSDQTFASYWTPTPLPTPSSSPSIGSTSAVFWIKSALSEVAEEEEEDEEQAERNEKDARDGDETKTGTSQNAYKCRRGTPLDFRPHL